MNYDLKKDLITMNTYSYNDESEKMKQRADGFTDIYNAYFDYNLNDEAITILI